MDDGILPPSTSAGPSRPAKGEEMARTPRGALGLGAVVLTIALITAAGGSSKKDTTATGSTGGGSGGGQKIALLLPETKTARYETQDKPLFEAKVKDLCSD